MTKNKHKEDSALSVNKGIEQPPSINPNTSKNLKKFKRKNLSLDDFMVGIKDGNRGILSQAITLAESSIPEHQELAQQII
jgi:GTPase